MDRDFDTIVVGSGVAGLSAAVTAAEEGLRVALVERAPEGEHGGNTRYTEAYLRMSSTDEVSDDFETLLAEYGSRYVDPQFLAEAGRSAGERSALMRAHPMLDPDVISTFSAEAGPTLRWLETQGVKFDFLPTAFLTTTTPRLLPVGGGLAIVEALTARARAAGVEMVFETTALALTTDDGGGVTGLAVRALGNRRMLSAGAVVLACGGFEGNAEMLAQYLGPQSLNLRPVARGGYYNKGEGIRMALAIGAAPAGNFGSYHAEPIDPRSGVAEPAVFTFPYGILVNRDGHRFTDEAPGLVDAVYENVTRRIYEQRDGIAYLILDAGIDDVPNWRRSLRSNQEPIRADDLATLADRCGIAPAGLRETVKAYNGSCVDGDFRPLELDGLATNGLTPPKSNWARPIARAPFSAIPIISANVFTFGGLKVNDSAQVLHVDGDPIRGLYAAGETMGIFFTVYTGSTSVLRGAVFGRLAARRIAAERRVPA